jgi:hypothetical protein
MPPLLACNGEARSGNLESAQTASRGTLSEKQKMQLTYLNIVTNGG